MGEQVVQSCPPAEIVSPFPVRSKISALPHTRIKARPLAGLCSPPFIADPTDEEKMEALSLAVRTGTRAEVAVFLAARSQLKVDELEKVHFLAFQSGSKAERLKELFCRAVDGRLTAHELHSLTPPSGVPAKEQANFFALAIRVGLYSCMEEAIFAAIRSGRWDDVKEVLPVAPAQSGGTMSDSLSFASLAVRAAICNGMEVEQILSFATNYVNNNADLACHVLVQNGIPADAVLEVAMKTGLMAREKVYPTLLEQLLGSFAKPQEDTQLREWGWPPKPKYSVTEKRSGPREDPKCPFFLINMKASAKTAQISWSMKKYPRFPRDQARHNPLRVARLGTGTDGFCVEQAGQGGQPGAISSFIDVTYSGWPRPKEGIFEKGSSVPLREVAVIKRLPGGDGISVMSYVDGLGVKLDDILFVLHVPSAAVPLRFTEQSFYISSNFKDEIPLYAPTGLDFIDINVPVKNLIKKLYQLYLQEEQEKKIKCEKQGHRGSEELVCQQEELMPQRHETEEEKLERLRRRREESKKHRDLRKEMKEVVHRIKDTARTSEEEEQHEEEYDPMLLPFLFQEECGLVKPLEELCQSEKRHDGSLVEVMEQYDLLDLSGGGSEARGMKEPSPALVY